MQLKFVDYFIHNILLQCHHEKLLHCTIIVIFSLLYAFELTKEWWSSHFPRCVGRGEYAWFPLEWAAVTMVIADLTEVEISLST